MTIKNIFIGLAIFGSFIAGTTFANSSVDAQQDDAMITQLLNLVIDVESQVIDLTSQVQTIETVPGPEGPEGPQGEQGLPGPTTKFYVKEISSYYPTQSSLISDFSCDPGDNIIYYTVNHAVPGSVYILSEKIVNDGNSIQLYWKAVPPGLKYTFQLLCADST